MDLNSTWSLSPNRRTSAFLNHSSVSIYVRLVAFPLVGGTVIAVTVAGNLLLIIGVRFVRRMREPGNYLFVSLAVADLFVGIVVMPLACIYEVKGVWTLGKAACDLWTYSDVMLCTASILHLCAISLDRCWTIKAPLRYAVKRTSRRMAIYMVITWLFAFLVSLPALCGFSATLEAGHCDVNPNIYYQIYATMVAFYIPVVIMVIVNCQIYAAVKKLATRDRSLSKSVDSFTSNSAANGSIASAGPSFPCRKSCDVTSVSVLPKSFKRSVSLLAKFQKQSTRSRSVTRPSQAAQERKAARNLTIIMGAFIICWLPFFATTLMRTLCMDGCNFVPDWWTSVVLWLGYANSALNPILVIAYNKDFKHLFLLGFSRYCCPWFVKLAGFSRPVTSTDYHYYYYSEPVVNPRHKDRKQSSYV